LILLAFDIMRHGFFTVSLMNSTQAGGESCFAGGIWF